MNSAGLLDVDLADPRRLTIACALLARDPNDATFAELVRVLAMTEGNLTCHLERLAGAGIVTLKWNNKRGRCSRTDIALTSAGRDRLAAVSRDYAAISRRIADALQAGRVAVSTLQQPAPNQVSIPSSGAESEAFAGSLVDDRISYPD